MCDHLLSVTSLEDFKCIRIKYGTDVILPVDLIRQKFCYNACISLLRIFSCFSPLCIYYYVFKWHISANKLFIIYLCKNIV